MLSAIAGLALCLPPAVAQSVAQPPADAVDPKTYGAVADGIEDDTAALSAAFETAIAAGRTIRLSGKYRITGPLQAYQAARAEGGLHIWCATASRIEVDRQCVPFGDVLYVHTRAVCDCSILGASLSIDAAHRAGRGITVRHNAGPGGKVNITGGLELSNFHERDEREVRENQALAIIGAFEQVDIRNVRVDGVRRSNPAGANKGIAVAGYTGAVRISDCTVKDVRVPSIGSADADGIAVFAKPQADFYQKRPASATVQRCTLIDCQGRSVKSQCSNTRVVDAVVRRQHAVSIRHSVEFDFQVGNGLVQNPSYHYKSSAGRSPLGASHSCIAFQQLQKGSPMQASAVGGQLHTEVSVPRYVAAIFRAWSADSEMQVDGLRVVPDAALDGTAVHRAFIELDISELALGSAKAKIAASNIQGPLQCPMVGYHSYSGQDVSRQLTIELANCTNDQPAKQRRLVGNVSGERIKCLPLLKASGNKGFADAELDCG